jgi:hypothetical protein
MLVSKVSMLSGVLHSLELPISPGDLARYELGKEKIQDIFPNLKAGEREFLKTGITDEEWNDAFLR